MMKNNLNELKDANIEFIKNLLAFVRGRTINFEEYIRMECQEIFSDENKWYTGENLNHPPTNIDCHKNYLNYKGDKLFHKRCHYLVERNWQKKTKKFILRVHTNFKNLPNITQRIGKVTG